MRLARKLRRDPPLMWAAIESSAPMIGCTPLALLDLAKRDEVGRGVRDVVGTDER